MIDCIVSFLAIFAFFGVAYFGWLGLFIVCGVVDDWSRGI